jgi:chemotaxis protein MotB
MARKKKHEEHENLERWLISYADFITLLFAFFVVMYSVSAVNEGKFRVLSESLMSAFRSQPKSPEPIQLGSPAKALQVMQNPNHQISATPSSRESDRKLINPPVQLPLPPIQSPMQADPAKALAAKQAQALKEMSDEIEKELGELIQRDLVTVRRTKIWMEVEIKTSILFPSGSAKLTPVSLPTLERVATVLKRYPNAIHVEGFTDNVPIQTSMYPSNWELSAARAASVVHLFTKHGVEPERLAATGFGEYRPAGDNKTADGRNANRRVVLVVLADASQRRPLELPKEPPETDTTAAESHGPIGPPLPKNTVILKESMVGNEHAPPAQPPRGKP